MFNLIYRGIPYQCQSNTIEHDFSNYTAKYRGCVYTVATPVALKPASKSKLTYRGCQVL